MQYIKRRIYKFNNIFNKEEKLVVVLASIVTILTIILGFILLLVLASKIFNLYVDLVMPHFIKALNFLIDIVLPGWHI